MLPRGQRWVPWDPNAAMGERSVGGRLTKLIQSEGVWVPRTFAEKSTDFMQVIPYTIVRKVAEPETVFAYKRTDKTGEPRLIGTTSFGVGGHITQHEDGVDLSEIVERSRQREFEEEVTVVSDAIATPIGILNDRDYDVSRVHLGLVFEQFAEEIKVNETEIIRGGWSTISEIRSSEPNLENWATLILYKHLMV